MQLRFFVGFPPQNAETVTAAANVLAMSTCPALYDPIDYTARGILQARILEWVAVPFSRVSSQPRGQTQVSHISGGFFTS